MNAPAIRITGLRKNFGVSEIIRGIDLDIQRGKSHVLHGVNLHVNPGEIVCLLGRNGVGRSTTAKAVMGQVVARGAVCASKARTSSAARPMRSPAWGWAWCRKTARFFQI